MREKMEGGRKGGFHHPPPEAAEAVVVSLQAPSAVLVNGDSSCFHLDYSHFLKFQKQQRERGREHVCVCIRLSPSHLSAFPLTAFEAAFGAESCLQREHEQTHVIGWNLEVQMMLLI